MDAVAQVRPSAPQHGADGDRARNFGLDVARCAAIVMVLGSHLATSGGALSPRVTTILDTIGQAGVELFFSLSGFLIGGILIRMSRRGISVRSAGRFMVRRWFRTLPLYFILLGTAGAWFRMDIRHSLMLVQNFFPAEPRALPVSWSLVMEEYFYVAFPMLMLAWKAAGVRGERLVGWTAAGLILCCTGVRLWNAYGFGPGWSPPFVHENPLLRLDCAAYGVVAAWLTPGADRVRRLSGRVILGSGLVVSGAATLSLVWVLGASIESLVAAGFLRWGPAFLALQTTVSDAGFALLVIGLSGLRPRRDVLASVITGLSVISYSIYLVHVPIIGVLAGLPDIDDNLRMASAAAITLAVSTATYYGVERPFLRLRERVVARTG